MRRRTIMVLLVYLIMFGTLLLVKPVPVSACSCAGPPSIEEQLNRKTAVFTSVVRSLTEPDRGKILSSADPVEILLEVKTVWKGELNSQTTVYTARSSVSCGYEGFEVNEEYLVFAYGDPDRLQTGLCEGNKPLATAQEELKALGAGYEPIKITLAQKDSVELASDHKETEERFLILPLVLAGSLTLLILLVLLLRWRRRR